MTISWEACLYTMVASIGGGFVQATTGFGYGIFVMLFFPLYLSILEASALSQAISLFLLISLTWRYHKHIRIKDVVLPAACYLIISTVMILFAKGFDFRILSIVFACVMIALALYMLFFSQKIRIKAGPVSAVLCSSLSGAASGLFGIGGPPMTLYYMTLYGGEKYAYLGTLQCFFLVTNASNNIVRLANGILTPELLQLVIPGVIGQADGAWIGNWVLPRIPVQQFRYVVYGFMVITGIITLISKR